MDAIYGRFVLVRMIIRSLLSVPPQENFASVIETNFSFHNQRNLRL